MNSDVPSILSAGVYDRDLSPTNSHNVEAAKRHGLRFDPQKDAFVDEDGLPIRDAFFQKL